MEQIHIKITDSIKLKSGVKQMTFNESGGYIGSGDECQWVVHDAFDTIKEKHIKMILAINEFQVEYNFPEILEAFLICSLRGIEKICYNLLKNNPQSGEISGDICSLRKAD